MDELIAQPMQPNQRPRRVMIATPAYDWKADVRYVHALIQTVRMGIERGIHIRELFEPGDSILPHVRNKYLRSMIEYDYDDLIFIDPDQDWPPEAVFKLLAHPVDCVGAAVRRKMDDEAYNVRVIGGASAIITDPTTGLLSGPGFALGTGMLRLSRKAVNALWENSEAYTVFMGGDVTYHWAFGVGPREVAGKPIKELHSEDMIVCMMLDQLGIRTWLDPTIICGHMGIKRYEGNFAEFLARLKTPPPEAPKA